MCYHQIFYCIDEEFKRLLQTKTIEFDEKYLLWKIFNPFGVAPTRFSLCRELLLTVTKSKVLRTFASYKNLCVTIIIN